MFNEYKFDLAASITENNNDANTKLYFMPMGNKVKTRVVRDWYKQYQDFIQFRDRSNIYEREHSEYKLGDKKERYEIFTISNFKTPSYIKEVIENGFSPDRSIKQTHLESDDNSENKRIKSIVSITSDNGIEYILFQAYQSSYQIVGGRLTMLYDADRLEFKNVFEKGLTLNSSLAAILNLSENQLLFHNFRTAKRVLNLDRYYKISSEKEIRNFITQDLFEPEDVEAIANNPSYDISEKVAIIIKEKKLDNVTAEDITEVAKDFNLPIDIKLTPDKKKVIFHGKRREAYIFLKFLDEDFSKGYFTKRQYMIRTKRSIS